MNEQEVEIGRPEGQLPSKIGKKVQMALENCVLFQSPQGIKYIGKQIRSCKKQTNKKQNLILGLIF